METHCSASSTWEEFKNFLELTYFGDKKNREITIKKELDSINLDRGESISSLVNRLSEKLSLLQFLNPTDYNNREKILKDKLLSAIPSSYYFRLEDSSRDSYAELLTKLEKIEKLIKAIETETKNSGDPAVRNIYAANINQVQTGTDLNQNGGNIPRINNGINYPIRNQLVAAINTRKTQDNVTGAQSIDNNVNKLGNEQTKTYESINPQELELIPKSSVVRFGDVPCNIHNGAHIRKDCEVTCGFCDLQGSHIFSECYRRNEIGNDFIQKKVEKFGIAAEVLARKLINKEGIYKVTDNCFRILLQNKTSPAAPYSYEGYKQRQRL